MLSERSKNYILFDALYIKYSEKTNLKTENSVVAWVWRENWGLTINGQEGIFGVMELF